MIWAQSHSSISSSAPQCSLVTGRVKLNDREVWSGGLCSEELDDDPGVHILKIDPFHCTMKDSESFDTYRDRKGGEKLRRFLSRKVSRGEVVIGMTAVEPTTYLGDALNVLQNIYGVNVEGVRIRESFAFVAQKGYPEKAALDQTITEKAGPARLKVTITGMQNLVLLGLCEDATLYCTSIEIAAHR